MFTLSHFAYQVSAMYMLQRCVCQLWHSVVRAREALTPSIIPAALLKLAVERKQDVCIHSRSGSALPRQRTQQSVFALFSTQCHDDIVETSVVQNILRHWDPQMGPEWRHCNIVSRIFQQATIFWSRSTHKTFRIGTYRRKIALCSRDLLCCRTLTDLRDTWVLSVWSDLIETVCMYGLPLTSEESMLRLARADTEPRNVLFSHTEQMLRPPPAAFVFSTSSFPFAVEWPNTL